MLPSRCVPGGDGARHVDGAVNRVAPHAFLCPLPTQAPHIQDGQGWPITIPAPWYNETFPGLRAPRTPNYNFSATDHHWMIAQQPPMTQEQADHSDALYRARWQALLSLDDIIEGMSLDLG